ncbi:Endoribonuclease L-PSP [Lacunisphaera limnophila]|uniref:Endoribonuclease L-PSP n=1 Tax=Lacunisphaera limnophila TaxID=1838286 RepID=A0A1D8AR10_9BACT|nr:RidA family protein [Lacunisphaera limnophila]AOS43274.1 Endoribonuclease L-PSP [Lacunisphaera limnophila]
MKSLLLLCLLAVTALAAADPAPAPKIEKFKLGDWEDDIGYRAAVRVGDTLYISGIAAAGPMPAAIASVYGELKSVLAAHGLTFAHVVKENLHTTDLEAVKAHQPLRRAWYGQDFPAATWVQISRLYQPDQILEVELIAVFPAATR